MKDQIPYGISGEHTQVAWKAFKVPVLGLRSLTYCIRLIRMGPNFPGESTPKPSCEPLAKFLLHPGRPSKKKKKGTLELQTSDYLSILTSFQWIGPAPSPPVGNMLGGPAALTA